MAFDSLSPTDPPETKDKPLAAVSNTPDLPEAKPSGGIFSGGKGVLIGMGFGIAIAVGGMSFLSRPANQAAPAAQQATVAGQSVTVETVKLTSVAQTFPVQGTVQARDWVSVLPRATGVQIKEIRVEEGQSVEAGQVIAVLDNSVQEERLNQAIAQAAQAQAQVSSAETQLESAKAQLQSAQAGKASADAGVTQKQAQLGQQQATYAEAETNRKRYENLANQGAVTQQELGSRNTSAITAQQNVRVAETGILSAQADVSKAQAEVSKAQAGVNQQLAGVNQQKAALQNAIAHVEEVRTQRDQATLVQAPASGIIAKKNVNVGDLTGNTALFSIIGANALELQAKVPETLLPKVRTGASARVTSDADKRLSVEGRVREVNPVVDDKTRQALVKIDLSSNSLLKPGMFLKAAIAFDSTQSLTVPTESVLSQPDGQKVVYVVDGDVVRSRTVQVGDPSEGRLIVKDGLKPGEQVVASGAGFLKDGDPVTITK